MSVYVCKYVCLSVCMYVVCMHACMYVHTCECLYICSACMQDIHTNTYPFCRQVLRRAGFCRAQNCSYGLQPHQDSKDFEIFHAVTGSLAHLIGDLAPNACLLEETRCEGADLLVTSLTEAPLNVGFQGFSCKPRDFAENQEIVQFLVHPQSPIQRLLVDHPTGSGKTREMVCILDNFFYDQRPKIAIFPKAAV